MNKFILAAIIFASVVFVSYGQQTPGVVRLYHRVGSHVVDPNFRDNRAALATLRQQLRQKLDEGTLSRVEVHSRSCPDGTLRINQYVSGRRADLLIDWIRRNTGVDQWRIERHSNGIAWEQLREQMTASRFPYRQEVLDVIDGAPQSGEFDDRVRKLMAIRGGEVYRLLMDTVFDEVRYSEVIIHQAAPPVVEPALRDTVFVQPAEPTPVQEPVLEQTPEPVSVSGPAPESQRPLNVHVHYHFHLHLPTATDRPKPVPATKPAWTPGFYVKTNAVGWAMIMVNAAVEIDLSRHLSFNLPVYYSAWNYFAKTSKIRMLALQPELRAWPMGDRRLFVGAHFGVAAYNFAVGGGRWRIQDYRGKTPALGGGVSVGYRLPLTRNERWGVEFSLGAGVYGVHYDKFVNVPNGAYDSSVRETVVILDNAAVSFSYKFDLKTRGGKR